jgi:hypothetical protein
MLAAKGIEKKYGLPETNAKPPRKGLRNCSEFWDWVPGSKINPHSFLVENNSG